MYAFALLLLLLPAIPAQQQTPSKHKKEAAKNDPTQSVFVIVNPATAQPSPAEQKNESDKKTHGWPPWWESFWPYWAEVIVTGFAGFAALLTLCAIRKQGSTMQRQLLEMRRTRIHTVREMKAAGQQTKDMLTQIEFQVGHLSTLATAAERSAKSAEITAERFAQIEGGRITVAVEWTIALGKRTYQDNGTMYIHIDVVFRNDGKSSAWIKQARLHAQIFENTILPNPDFINIPIIFNGIKILEPTQDYRRQDTPLLGQHDGIGRWIIIWGIVEFGDTFRNDKESTFGYIVSVDDKIQRLNAIEYNKQT